jgi:hypothetical protein
MRLLGCRMFRAALLVHEGRSTSRAHGHACDRLTGSPMYGFVREERLAMAAWTAAQLPLPELQNADQVED